MLKESNVAVDVQMHFIREKLDKRAFQCYREDGSIFIDQEDSRLPSVYRPKEYR